MLSLGIEASRAFWTARPSAGLASTLPPPSRAATVIARASLVKSLPRLASAAPFLCLIEDHLECPDMASILGGDPETRTGAPRAPRPTFPAKRPYLRGFVVLICRNQQASDPAG